MSQGFSADVLRRAAQDTLLRKSCMLLILCSIYSISAHAQLATYVNERGTLVFTNADLPPRPAPSTAAKSASSTPQPTEAKPAVPVKPDSPTIPPKDAAFHGSPPNASALPQASIVSTKSSAEPLVLAPERLDRIVIQSAQRNHVDPALVRAVITAESNWNSFAVSSTGAQGLMQLIPGTARLMGVGNAFDPAQNVDGGVRYLRMLLERYNGDLSKALAAYNAGPGVVDRIGGVPDIRETRDYVRKVTSTYFSPGSDRQEHAVETPNPIYRTTDGSGRLVFTNE